MALTVRKVSEMLKVYIRDGDYNKVKELLAPYSDKDFIAAIETQFAGTDPVNYAIDNMNEGVAIFLVEKGFTTTNTYKLPGLQCDQWCYHDHGHSKCPAEYDALDNASVRKMRKLRDLITDVREGRRQLGDSLHEPKLTPTVKSPPANDLHQEVHQTPRRAQKKGAANRRPAEEAAAWIFEHGATFVTKEGNTLLHRAATKPAVFTYVLANRGVPVNVQNKAGDTALHLAVREGNIEVAEALLLCCADTHIRNQMGQTPLDEAEEDMKAVLRRFVPGVVTAVTEGRGQILERLLRSMWISLDAIAKGGKTLFQIAMEKAEGSLDAASCCRIIHEFTDTNELVHAVLAEDLNKVKLLLNTGKNVSINVRYRDRVGKTLLSHAIDSDNLELVAALVEAGARVNRVRVRDHATTDRTVPLFQRTLRKGIDPEIARFIHSVQNKTEILEKDYNGNTAILKAIEEDADARVVQWLLTCQNGLNIFHRNQLGRTPREVAVLKGRTDIVHVIDKFVVNQLKKFFIVNMPVLFYGLENVHAKDESGKTLAETIEEHGDKDDLKILRNYTEIENRGIALFEAAARGDLEQVASLNEASFQDKNGYTALTRAVVFNQLEVAKHLCLSRPMLKAIPDNCNRYPLHYACSLPKEQAVAFVKLFLEKNAEDLEKRVDKDGKFPVDYKVLQTSKGVRQALYDARTLDAHGKRGPPLGPWPPGAETFPPS